jgi:hypothetical protein
VVDVQVDVSNNGMDFTNDMVRFEVHVSHKLVAIELASGSVFRGFEVFLHGRDFTHDRTT